jgi:hypothetical protein
LNPYTNGIVGGMRSAKFGFYPDDVLIICKRREQH